MSIQPMESTQTTIANEVNILKRPEYEAIAKTLDASAFTNGVCKAGTPITASGTIDNTSSSVAIGLLLKDVKSTRPQASLLTKGYVYLSKVESNSGLTIVAKVKSNLPMVVFE